MGQCRDKWFEGRPHEVWKVLCSDSIRTYIRTYQKQRHPWHWVRTALASPPSSSSPANDTDMTWHLTCDIDMPHHAIVSRHRDIPGPSGTTSRNYAVHWVISNYVRFLSRWFYACILNCMPKDIPQLAPHGPTIETAQVYDRWCAVAWDTVWAWLGPLLRLEAQRFHVPNETHFAFEDTDVALQE